VNTEVVRRNPAAALRGRVSSYYGYREETSTPIRRREGPGFEVLIVISFGEEWLIDNERFVSFAAGLHDRQVTTEHAGRSFGMQINLAPPAAHMLFGFPLHELAHSETPLENALDQQDVVDRLYDEPDWGARFELLDAVLMKRLADARPPSAGVDWAWRRLVETDGRIAVSDLARELGWSRKRIVARFREEVGLPPKTVARLLRFERARATAECEQRPDWTRIALECGYYDQSHLINDFRAVTGRTPATFFQDTAAPAA
jgi:AraC-like DNA-binding protein